VSDRSIAGLAATDFAHLVEPHLPKMLNLAKRLGGDATGEDIVQDALLNAWRKRGQFDPARGSLGSWLMAITADQARKSWRRRLSFLLRLPAARAPAEPDDRIDIERSLRLLSARQRLAIDCFYFARLSVAETAAVMHCGEGTVKSTLSDARAKLRPALEVRE
jgi:RNA polymerase sigma-70 factor (ECF subfamily)